MKRITRWCVGILAMTATVVALTSAPASAASSTADTAAKPSVEQLAKAKTAPTGSVHTSGYFANCPLGSSYCYYDSGWEPYDGGCQARTQMGWWRGTNQVSLRISVYSPFLFAACRVNATPLFGTTFGIVAAGKPFYAMACAALDPTCSNQQVWTYFDNSGLPPFFVPYVNAISVSHTKA